MCGRFVSSSPPDEVARYFSAEPPETSLPTSYNVAPSQGIYAVAQSRGDGAPVRRLGVFRWGLVPRWAKDVRIGYKMINARAETVATKNAYKSALRHRRCIVPANGFYEWTKRPDGTKQPMFVHRPDGEPYAFAGLWETWRPKDPETGEYLDDEVLRSCTIITTAANDAMAAIHDRMPAMLRPDGWAAWLDRDNDDVDSVLALLTPGPSELVAMHPVSTEVNNARNQGAHLVERVDLEAPTLDEGRWRRAMT